MDGILYVAESCPGPVRKEAANRGWPVEPFVVEEHNGTGKNHHDGFVLVWRNCRFTPTEFKSARTGQRMNHFPHSKSITKKDLLVRNIRKMKAVHGKIYGFVPQAFILPTEYTKFVKRYARDDEEENKSVWICKPSDLSRGRKIFLIRDLSELHYDQQFVIQRYLPNPLTIGGYKVDLRVYILVSSLQPLRIHVYRDGLCRFGTEKYDTNLDNIDNIYSHLTNASINKFSETYGDDKDVIGSGSKWDFKQLQEWLQTVKQEQQQQEEDGEGNKTIFHKLWAGICDIAILTILTILQPKDTDPTSSYFELFGFDILVDESFQPWLLEVNCAPALSIDGDCDARVKEPLIRDLFDIIQNEQIDKDPMSMNRMLRKKSSHARKTTVAPVKASRPIAQRLLSSVKRGTKKVAPISNNETTTNEVRDEEVLRDDNNCDANNKDDEKDKGKEKKTAKTHGNFEQIFPFDEVTEDATSRIYLGSGKPVISQQDFTANIRTIVNQIKKRRK